MPKVQNGLTLASCSRFPSHTKSAGVITFAACISTHPTNRDLIRFDFGCINPSVCCKA